MRPILALNCLLQIEQERSEEESSVDDALALAFRCARFCSASLMFRAPFLAASPCYGGEQCDPKKVCSAAQFGCRIPHTASLLRKATI